MPVKRTKISRRQSLPTISEAHGAISSFPMPEIKGAPTEVAPFIERDDITENRERRMGRLTKEEREAKRKARKEKKRAEKRRAKELGSSKKDESSTMPTVSEEQDPVSGAFPSSRDPVPVSIVSPRKSPFKSPRVSLEDAIRKRNHHMTAMDFSNLSAPSISEESEVDTLGTQEDIPTSFSGAVVSGASIGMKKEANGVAVNPFNSPITALKGDLLTGSETFDRNANLIAAAGVASNTSISMIYDHSDHKVGGDSSDTTPQRHEMTSTAEGNLITEKKSQIVAGTNGKKSSWSFFYGDETSKASDSPKVPDDDVKGKPVITGSPQPEQDSDDEESARIAAEVDRLLMSATKELLQPQMPSNITNGAPQPGIIVASSLTAVESVRNPSASDALSFATKGPYSREESFTGSVDDMTVEVSQSSSENEFDELNLAIDQVADPNRDSSVHDSECYSDTSANIARSMRRITIRRASMCGPKPDYPDSSDDEDISTPGATPITPYPSIDAKQDRPVRRESKANLRKLRQGPQMFTTSALGIVSLSGDDEEIVADDDIIVHAFPVGDDLLVHGNGNGVQVHHTVEAREDCTRYDPRSNARQFQSNEESELVLEEQKESKRNWIILIVLLLASGLASAIYFGVTTGDNGSASGLQSPYPDESTPMGPSQPPTGVLKYDPPTAEECGIIENGGTLEGEDELLRRDFDLLIDVELINGFSLDGPTTLLPDLQARMNKYLIPHLAGCENGPRGRLLRGQSSVSRRLANVRYVIANADAIVKLDESRTCETSAAITNCYAVKMSLHLKLKGEEKNFPITKVVHQSLDENNSLTRTLQLSAPFGEAFVCDIIATDSATVQTMAPTESPSAAATVQTNAPTESPSSAPSIDSRAESPST